MHFGSCGRSLNIANLEAVDGLKNGRITVLSRIITVMEVKLKVLTLVQFLF